MTYSGLPYGDDLYGGSEDIIVQDWIIYDTSHTLSSDNVIPTQNTLNISNSYHSLVSSGSLSLDAKTTSLVWHGVGKKKFETGLDRGVLYLDDGSGVAWNGLISVVEKSEKEISSAYYDGMKINNSITLGDFSGTLKAFTYPDEFLECEGIGQMRDGIFIGNQTPKMFNLSYRTKIGNELDDDLGYKIHILYNLTAIPSDKNYASLTADSSLVEFEWDISAIPEDIEGYSPISHIIINSVDLSPEIMQEIEKQIYGVGNISPMLPPMPEFIDYLQKLSESLGTLLILITDNGDGTWTASTGQENIIEVDEDGTFQIFNATATFFGDSYNISDTYIS